MATGASIVKKYEIADQDERISLMLSNYSSFETQLEIEMDGIEYSIREERAYKKRSGIEELGVRVQVSSNGSPTEAKAIEALEIEQALANKDFSNPILKNISGIDEIQRDVYAIEIMKMDFAVFKKQMLVLKPLERKMILKIYDEGVDFQTVADEEQIDYESVRTRVKRARTKVKDNMFVFWKGHQRRGL